MYVDKFAGAFAGSIFLPAAAASVLMVAACLIFILLRRHKPQHGDLLILRETGMTAVLGIALWLEVLIILYFAVMMPERILVDDNSRINTAIFMLLGAAVGSAAMLYAFVKCIVVREKELIGINSFGRQTSLKWAEIKTVSATPGKRLTISDAQSKSMKIGGESKSFQKFLQLAIEKLPPEIDRKPLRSKIRQKMGRADQH